ncbi:hypothetical protein [Nocardioides eburneiflavus]|uniref:hypothetical protein n=1 Tax=Nocardioides eburneiflavus TaxID=2518372 RepID=UPI001FE65A68|nr:hypothetical protein [Nocardioides eburneiflavus]
MRAAEVVEGSAWGRAVRRVVDAQAVDESLVEPPLDLDVRLGEDLGVLDPYGGERVDGEEPAVVEVVVGRAPADQLVVLLLPARGAGSHRKRWSW